MLQLPRTDRPEDRGSFPYCLILQIKRSAFIGGNKKYYSPVTVASFWCCSCEAPGPLNGLAINRTSGGSISISRQWHCRGGEGGGGKPERISLIQIHYLLRPGSPLWPPVAVVTLTGEAPIKNSAGEGDGKPTSSRGMNLLTEILCPSFLTTPRRLILDHCPAVE